jgi:hypothetical protein
MTIKAEDNEDWTSGRMIPTLAESTSPINPVFLANNTEEIF